VIHNIDAIRNISSIIAKQSLDTLWKYTRKHFIESQAFHLPKRFRTNLKNQKGTTSGILNTESRKIECGKYVNQNMQLAVSKLYIDKYYDKRARNEVYIIKFYVI
jgi:predicted metalloendopeptidase